jgi:hypothetical protein
MNCRGAEGPGSRGEETEKELAVILPQNRYNT